MVCNQCHEPLQRLSISLIQQEPSKQLKSLLRIFYNLNYQDLHPLFEDNVQHWMGLLK
jgi:exportin-2 (importin alpha re-exporter)